MAKKKILTPRLPSKAGELLVKGFGENRSVSHKFVTDEHSLILAKMVKDKKLLKDAIDGSPIPTTTEAAIDVVWDKVAKRDNIDVLFIGCGQAIGGCGDKIIVALLRDANERILFVDPYKLAFLIRVTEADTMAVDKSAMYERDPLAISRGDKMVAVLMPMRFKAYDFKAYDLSGPGIPLADAFVEAAAV